MTVLTLDAIAAVGLAALGFRPRGPAQPPPSAPKTPARPHWPHVKGFAGSAYIPAPQLAHRFALWMVEQEEQTGWLLSEMVDDYIEKFCREKDYREPCYIEMRSILSAMPGVVYLKKKRIRHPEFAELWGATKAVQPTVWRFTKRASQLLRPEFNHLSKVTGASRVVTVTPEFEPEHQAVCQAPKAGKSGKIGKKSSKSRRKNGGRRGRSPYNNDLMAA